jgi:hypothetical protein
MQKLEITSLWHATGQKPTFNSMTQILNEVCI